MSEQKTLNLVFLDDQGKDFTIRIQDPKEDLDPGEIEAAMGGIMTSEAFPEEGDLVSIKGADLITRTKLTLLTKE